MKKLIALSAIAMLSSGAALAENINISGSVASVCEVSNLDTSTYFPSIAKDQTTTLDFELQCNDSDGATLKLTTSEGHLQNADDEDDGVGYTAALTAAPFAFTLIADDGDNDESAEQSQPGSAALAVGGIPGTIVLTITEDPIFSGTYSDTLMLTVTAN
ncbi:hypothetical protein MKZ42_07825 [Pseudoalteromonas shioyasakiensis]|uniref:Spore coat protein U domain-containing protein n=1 Tax=Pseudoalteromonas shioyasakiensis TaxID=1190813 RepID=A0ABT6TXL5_9GAMM|nr:MULTISPECIES: hypothetical protein [Pseudoalteromonas]MDI4667598.1 hypothetical protein [Pseudoalteromonas shioyasakiensis]MDI4673171.1 hypothetical protein [Pseudoalteromonas shioyasakiensis]MDI4685236.1 hypothetical protein [Pseudoalteromonas shioyasakiensis]MDI4705037.1 hypothetical protein [Pseudoalteromonas shioyasakiensis]NUJ20572.1 hypothetical protein [Pseudoalteromonas sp. 0802]